MNEILATSIITEHRHFVPNVTKCCVAEEVQKLQRELSFVTSEGRPNGTAAIDGSTAAAAPAASDYDWSQVNSDLKKVTPQMIINDNDYLIPIFSRRFSCASLLS